VEKVEVEGERNSTNTELRERESDTDGLTCHVAELSKTITVLKGKVFNFEDMQGFNDKIRKQL
jgi:chromosome segregation ATPase